MKFASLFIRRRVSWIIAVLCVALGVGVIAGLPSVANDDRQASDSLPAGAESTVVVELQQELPGSDILPALVVIIKSDGSEFTAQEVGEAQQLAQDLASFGKDGAPVAPAIPSESGETILITVPLENTNDAVALSDTVDEIAAEAEAAFADPVTVGITGGAGFTSDIAKAFEGADFTLLAATALIVAALLLITYRSPILWIIPIVVVGVADQVAAKLSVNTSLLLGVPVDESGTGILSVLVFGAGTNYALLLISRYRDELRLEFDRYVAMRRAWVGTVEAITGAALTVSLSLLTLLLSAFPATRGLGLICAIGVLIALFYALFVLPCALVIFGRGVFWPLIPKVGDALTYDRAGFWKRVGGFTQKRPAIMLVSSLIVIGILALGNIGSSIGLSASEQFRGEPQSVTAAERLADEFGEGVGEPVYVIVPVDDVDEVTAAIEDTGLATSIVVSNENDDIAQLDVTVDADPTSEEAKAAVVDLREATEQFPEVYVGGAAATEYDRQQAVIRDQLLIAPIILVLVLIVLLTLLRSVVASILLVLSVVATYAAALGAAWLIFDNVFGFSGLADSVPLIAFIFLVALGVDYNIFLSTRAREETRTRGTRGGMLYALAATGGVITSAGILLAAVFAVLGVLPVIVLTQIGFIVGIGVLLDTLVVRTVLVPSMAFVLGDRFWWPHKVAPATQGDGDTGNVENSSGVAAVK